MLALKPKYYAVWRINDRLGNPVYLGSVKTMSEDEAERLGRERFGCEPSDCIEIEVDDDDLDPIRRAGAGRNEGYG